MTTTDLNGLANILILEVFFIWGTATSLADFIKSIKSGIVSSTYGIKYSKKTNILDYYFFCFFAFLLFCFFAFSYFFAFLVLAISNISQFSGIKFLSNCFETLSFTIDRESYFLLIFGFGWMLFVSSRSLLMANNKKQVLAFWGKLYKHNINSNLFYLIVFMNFLFMLDAVFGTIISIIKIFVA